MSKKLIGAAIVSLAVAGCSTLSKVDADGQTTDPVFPDIDKTTFDVGSYPNLDNLRQVQEGVTRDQLYDLLGRPHFAEGFKVREWDYLFHFNTPDGLKTCQYKILFDKDRIGRTFHWRPAECASILSHESKQALKPFTLSGDVGFAFGSSTLTAAGISEVRQIARQMKQVEKLEQVTVSGHTDRIGDEASNLRLSKQRAESVKRALVVEGIPGAKIRAVGYGKDRPVVQCDQQIRSDLIACLAPNRRVDIDIQGER